MTYDSVQPVLQWIAAHPTWAGFAVFLISLSESLAIVGLVVPGVVMMTAIGAMMGGGILPFWETLIWAILGAIAGDGISYWLGHHYHEHLRQFWPFKQFPQLLARGETFFKDHGGKSIIFGRFVGPVRPMIPVIAGMMDMTPRRFLFFNIVSAFAWAPLYSLPGILIGASLGMLSPEVARRIVLLILLLLLALWIIYVFLLKLGLWIGGIISRFINHLWRRVNRSHRLTWLHRLLTTAGQGTEEGQLGILILCVCVLTAFVFTTLNVIHFDGIALWDEPVYQVLRALYSDRVVDWVTLFTGLGEPTLVVVITVSVALFLIWRKRYFAAFCWFFTIMGGEAIGHFIRQWVAMPRPEGLVYLSHKFSYPSGHALSATLLYGLTAAYIHPMLAPNHRYIPWAISIPLILLISLSRIYLGVHWFTDIIGGITLGIASVAFGMLVFRCFERQPLRIRTLLIPTLVVLLVSISYYAVEIYPRKRTELVRQWPVQEFDTQAWWTEKANMGYQLTRTGALKKIATVFDVQWLGSLDNIQTLLQQQGFELAPKLDFNSSLMFLASEPKPNLVAVLPKFHRDRLPMLVMIKTLSDTERLVLQLWQSDYKSENNMPLWVGTLRLESAKHPLPLITTFQETTPRSETIINEFAQSLKGALKNNYRLVDTNNAHSKILLIKEPPGFTAIRPR